MEFIKTIDPAVATDALLKRLQDELTGGKKVLLLLSGGSVITSEVQILQALQKKQLTPNLTIMLMDERYGTVGHPDSNWAQLLEAGMGFIGEHAIAVLAEPLKPFDETIAAYNTRISKVYEAVDMIIGLFGLGPDAHTAGILPNSPATKETKELVVGYEAPPLKRITLTRKALLRVNAGYVFAYGETKAKALNRLKANTEPFSTLPAKLLWELPEAYIYNDQQGEPA